MNSSRSVIVIAFLISLAFSALALAQFTLPNHPRTLSWDELAAHAGLKALKHRAKEQFQIDVLFDFPPSILVIKSAIHLTPEEWSKINVSTGWQQLPPWATDKMEEKVWKSTVDLGLPDEYKEVNVDRLKYKDKAVILHGPGTSARLYMLSPNADGKSGVLYYFYRSF
ncbi:MAG: hypothetical protein JWR15_4004 [Prosthecobacter sp.]|nr:hypothetical protein [Prosthecobacter sp.]